MNSKEKLFRVIQMYGFALDEIRIYLDTHLTVRMVWHTIINIMN